MVAFSKSWSPFLASLSDGISTTVSAVCLLFLLFLAFLREGTVANCIGADAGFSCSPNPESASKLKGPAKVAGGRSCGGGGAPRLEGASEPSLLLRDDPPRPIVRPLLLRDANIDVETNGIS